MTHDEIVIRLRATHLVISRWGKLKCVMPATTTLEEVTKVMGSIEWRAEFR